MIRNPTAEKEASDVKKIKTMCHLGRYTSSRYRNERGTGRIAGSVAAVANIPVPLVHRLRQATRMSRSENFQGPFDAELSRREMHTITRKR
jgi:hypothetical protein